MINNPANDAALRIAQPNARKRKAPEDDDHLQDSDDDDHNLPPSPSTVERVSATVDSMSSSTSSGGINQCQSGSPPVGATGCLQDSNASPASSSTTPLPLPLRQQCQRAQSSPSASASSSGSHLVLPQTRTHTHAKKKRRIESRPSRRLANKFTFRGMHMHRTLRLLSPSKFHRPSARHMSFGMKRTSMPCARSTQHPSSSSSFSSSLSSSSSRARRALPAPRTPVPDPHVAKLLRAGSPSATRNPSSPGPARGCLHQSCTAFRFASLMDGVHFTRTPTYSPVFVPPILPPINRYTLQELDMEAIMKNPQLRHDLLFDVGLQFRPTESWRKRETTNMYWKVVKSELEFGCACISFGENSKMQRHMCSCTSNIKLKSLQTTVVSDEETRELLEQELPMRVPSRIRPLIDELREVITNVVLRPCAVPFKSFFGTHAYNPVLKPRKIVLSADDSIAWVHDAFDTPLIEQQLRHKVFNPAKLFLAVGELLGRHCAPIRDNLVQKMITQAQRSVSGDYESLDTALGAMRTCFELLEYMHLDTANYLLTHLRPYLMSISPQIELQNFKLRHESDYPLTREWFKTAHQNLASSPELYKAVDVLPSPQQMKSITPFHRVIASVLTALVDLIVFPPTPPSTVLPPSPTTTPVTKTVQQVQTVPGYPETLYLDHARLLMLTADAADINAHFMILTLFRTLSSSVPQKDGKRFAASDGELESLKREVSAIGPSRLGVCFCKEFAPTSSGEDSDVSNSHRNSDVKAWTASMDSVNLHLAQRLTMLEKRQSSSSTDDASELQNPALVPPSPENLKRVQQWINSNLHNKSEVCAVFRRKLANAILKALIHRFFHIWTSGIQKSRNDNHDFFSGVNNYGKSTSSSPCVSGSTSPSSPNNSPTSKKPVPKTGLEPLSSEIRVLSEKLAKLAVLHLRVYMPLYENNEFLANDQ